MDKKKKDAYLSELFLENLNGDFSRHAVLRALEKCNDEIRKRMGVYSCARGLIDYFLYREKHMRKLSNQIMQELEDFWDVYSEFDHMLRPGIKRNILILQMI